MEKSLNLLDFTLEELQDFLVKKGQQKFRAGQIFEWIQKGVFDIEQMSNLPAELRRVLKTELKIGNMSILRKLVSSLDGTMKYLFGIDDGNAVESVLMEYKHGLTVCISSQVGCRMGCAFCASTGAGFIRNLSAGEMLGQVMLAQADSGKRISNIVIMGVGEPLDNYDNVLKFLKIVNAKYSLNIGYRHITLSTCGLVPQMLNLAKEEIPVNLSVSLHAPNDEIRERMMPVNRKYSIDKILEACKIYTEVTRRRITFEYAIIRNVNDSKENALQLAGKLKGMLCHVNLIPVNTVEGAGFVKATRQHMEMFKDILKRYGIETTIRRELGQDINAACGQLRRSMGEVVI